jgi:hypothetical protein
VDGDTVTPLGLPSIAADQVQFESYVDVKVKVNPVAFAVAVESVILIAALFLVTEIVYVLVVPPDDVTTMVIVVAEPAVKLIDWDAVPEVTEDPFTVIDDPAAVAVGVTVIDDVAF